MELRSRLSPLTLFPTRRLWHTTVLFPAGELDFALAPVLAGPSIWRSSLPIAS